MAQVLEFIVSPAGSVVAELTEQFMKSEFWLLTDGVSVVPIFVFDVIEATLVNVTSGA